MTVEVVVEEAVSVRTAMADKSTLVQVEATDVATDNHSRGFLELKWNEAGPYFMEKVRLACENPAGMVLGISLL